ncbi:2OG-Fe dioxygenase family protein [Prochlorococcus marinus]|uniref:2OG-Fe dioxygenase family protein n=1 Tax=Prochlorococcus marinus TaxID=1219 RepID=UPI0007B3A28E|nr:2OG-Fe dioxygenase family protein [Prochlorococcus marinus]KZR78114.1 hypothetical protein PMIT1320_00196 [Prochlorococcus marinus str. MIT 1320]
MLLTYEIIKRLDPSEKLLQSFSNLQDDKYLKEKYSFRKRGFRKGVLTADLKVELSDDNIFIQDIRINKYLGGLERRYPGVCKECIEYTKKFLMYHEGLIKSLTKGDIYNIGIHQIRITAINDNEGLPVPEGYHQDGVDYVIIIPINTRYVSGGMHSLRYGSQDGTEILDKRLEEGEAIILNDAKVFHYAGPIYAKYQDIEGTRDSIIITLIRS